MSTRRDSTAVSHWTRVIWPYYLVFGDLWTHRTPPDSFQALTKPFSWGPTATLSKDKQNHIFSFQFRSIVTIFRLKTPHSLLALDNSPNLTSLTLYLNRFVIFFQKLQFKIKLEFRSMKPWYFLVFYLIGRIMSKRERARVITWPRPLPHIPRPWTRRRHLRCCRYCCSWRFRRTLWTKRPNRTMA